MNYTGISNRDTFIRGKLTDHPISGPHILVVNQLTFNNIMHISNSQAVIFILKLNPYAHETILFEDYFIPCISGVDHKVIELVGHDVTLSCKDGIGVVCKGKIKKPENNEKTKMHFAFTSTIAGMKFCSKAGASIVATRGEFIFFQSSEIHPLDAIDTAIKRELLIENMANIIRFGVDHFTSFIYRFTDFTGESAHIDPLITF